MPDDESRLIERWKKFSTAPQQNNHMRRIGPREWFKVPSDSELAEWLAWLIKQPYVATSERVLERMPFVESMHWLPDNPHFAPKKYGGLGFDLKRRLKIGVLLLLVEKPSMTSTQMKK
jgi:hypothetical protein